MLQTVDGIHSQVGGMLRHKPEEAELKLPEELQALFHSIEGLRRDCEAVPRPPELPELSDSIENVQVRCFCVQILKVWGPQGGDLQCGLHTAGLGG